MKISVRNLEPTKVKLTVTVDPEEFNPYLDEARKEIAKQVNVPGFRKGHVPGKIIDQRIDSEVEHIPPITTHVTPRRISLN